MHIALLPMLDPLKNFPCYPKADLWSCCTTSSSTLNLPDKNFTCNQSLAEDLSAQSLQFKRPQVAILANWKITETKYRMYSLHIKRDQNLSRMVIKENFIESFPLFCIKNATKITSFIIYFRNFNWYKPFIPPLF